MVMSSPEDVQQQILIVEDDEDTAEVVCTLLQDAGFEATAVDHGQAALNEISSMSPDLVLLDINLPDMNGIDILKTLISDLLPGAPGPQKTTKNNSSGSFLMSSLFRYQFLKYFKNRPQEASQIDKDSMKIRSQKPSAKHILFFIDFYRF